MEVNGKSAVCVHKRVSVFTHHLSRTDLSCIVFSQTDNLQKTARIGTVKQS